jgi:predicted DNA-binding mobile mystery protein A
VKKTYARIYRKIQLDDLNKAAAFLWEWRSRPVHPDRGWLRSIREALGLSLEEVGIAARMKRQSVSELQRAELTGKITLVSLRRVADAMGCELVYAILPKSGRFTDLARKVEQEKLSREKQKAREQAAKLVHEVNHTMALEGQNTGRVKDRIEEETQRILKPRKSKK